MIKRALRPVLRYCGIPATLLFFGAGVCMGEHAPSALDLDRRTAKKIRALEEQTMIAAVERNITALDKLLAEGFRLTGAPLYDTGSTITKQEYLHAVQHALRLDSFDFLDVEVSQYGPVVMVYSRLHWNGQDASGDLNEHFFISDVWVQQEQCWRLISRHMSRLSKDSVERLRHLKQLVL